MIVECEHCHAKYHYDEARFAGKGSKKLRCSRCQTIFEVFNTRAYEAQPAVRPLVTPGETRMRRDGARPSSTKPVPTPRPVRTPKLPADRKISLAVIAGPDAGKMFVLEKPRAVIGREEVDFALDDPEISRHHAAIEVSGEEITLVDLGSTNGTLIGDSLVTEAPLENQGEFTIGGSTLMLIVTPV